MATINEQAEYKKLQRTELQAKKTDTAQPKRASGPTYLEWMRWKQESEAKRKERSEKLVRIACERESKRSGQTPEELKQLDNALLRAVMSPGSAWIDFSPRTYNSHVSAQDMSFIDIIRTYLDAGANPDVKDETGLSASKIATWNGYHGIARLLKNYGAMDRVI